VRILVVGNPCNTNCLIAKSNAPIFLPTAGFAMTRLDENRAKSQLAKKAGVPVSQVDRVAIWGNHSATQFPDFSNARINGRTATETITDRAYLEGEFLKTVQQRGAEIIKARGASSAGSAANAAIDSVRSVVEPTQNEDWHSLAVPSDGSYGIEPGLIVGFPTRSNRQSVEIVQGLHLDAFCRAKVDASVEELREEKALVSDLLQG
jgi:malate dehydrogenase